MTLSNLLAIFGVVAVVVGVGMVNLAAGVISLGAMLIVGAIATARLGVERAKIEAVKKAVNL